MDTCSPIEKQIFLTGLLICLGWGSWAQTTSITYFADESITRFIDSTSVDFPEELDSSMVEFMMRQNIREFQKQGFLSANLDSVVFERDSSVNVHFYIGKKLEYGIFDWTGLEKSFYNIPTLRNFNPERFPTNPADFQEISYSILGKLEDSGYPLARIYLENKRLINDTIHAEVVIDKGQKIVFGGWINKADSVISQNFLARYLDIKPDMPFQMSKINSIQEQINQLSYVRLKANPEIQVRGSKAYLHIPLAATPASRFDFLIGVLPNVENPERFTISGEVTADFKNKLKRGEELYFYFRQLKPETQRIDFRVVYPYLLNLPFGAHGDFALYRNGRESRDLNAKGGIQYRSGKNLESRFFVDFQSSRLIEIDTLQLLSTGELPASLDVSLNSIGARITSDQRDYRFNPRKGLLFEFAVTAGIKSIIPNLTITSLSNADNDFVAAYDSLDLQVFQTNAESTINYFLPLRRSSTLLIGNRSGVKWSQQPLFFNEYYRIGGSGILRGFDEESIRAQYFSVLTAEFRYLLGLNSYFSTFVDYAAVYNDFRESQKWDLPFGFGVGLSFQTSAGIFALNVALGRQLQNPLDFRNAKTHFGFVSLF